MSKKIFVLFFLMLVLISMSVVSAAGPDDNIDTIVSSEDAGVFAVANDVGTIDNSNGDVADGNDRVLEKDAKSLAVGENNEIYGGAYENYSSQLLAASDENNVLEDENDGGILKETSATWYVDANAASGGDGRSEATAFQTMQNALDVVGNNDIIKIAAGTYTGTDNVGLNIVMNLTLEKYGDGEAIFDAQSNDRILNIYAETVNII